MTRAIKKSAVLLISAAMTLQLCSCHERVITDKNDRAELSFSWWGGDDRNERTLNGLHIFTDETGLTVRPTYSEFTGFKSNMDAKIYAGTEADVMQLNYDWIYQYTQQGEEFYDLSTLDSVDLSTYPEGSLDCGLIDGKQQAIPYGFNALTFIYNKTLFDSYGMDIPSTWEELFDAAAVMSRDDIYVMALTEKQFWMTACTYLEQTTGHMAFDGGKLLLTEEDIAAMLEFSKRLLDERVSPIGSDYDRREFSTQRMAGTITWSSDAGYFETSAAEIRAELVIGDYLTDKNYISFGWYQKPTGLYAVRKDTAHPEDAGRLVDYLINSADMAASLGMSKGVPVSNAAEEALEARGLLKGVEYEANRKMRAEGRLKTMSPVMENAELMEIYADALKGIYYGSVTEEEAVEVAFERMRAVML